MKKLMLIPLALSVFSNGAMAGHIDDILGYGYSSSAYRWNSYSCDTYTPKPYQGSNRRTGYNCEAAHQDEQAVKACEIALSAALSASAYRIAEKATRDGILIGYNCGVDKGIGVGNSQYNRSKAEYNFSHKYIDEIENDYSGSLLRYAEEPAANAAIGQAQNDVTARFTNAVTENGGEIPSTTPGNPNLNGYQGVSDGYNKNGHSVPSIGEILDSITGDQYITIGSYFSHDYGFTDWQIGERRYHRSRRGYEARYGVPNISNPDRVWDRIVDTRSRYLPRRLEKMVKAYKRLSHSQIEKVTVTWVQPEPLEDGTLPASREVITKTLTDSPRQIFENVFRRVWHASLTRAYNRILERNLDRGFKEGFPIGEDAGQRLAFALGTQDEYNALYRDESIKRYKNAFTPSYNEEFGASHREMSNKSVLSNLHWDVVGNDNDGALLLNEKIAFEFGYKNIGGQGIEVGARGGINDSENTKKSNSSYNVTALSNKTFKTESFLIVPENAISLNEKQANVSISFGSEGRYSSKIKTVFKPAGFENGSPQANLQNSELIVPVTISNPKNISSDEEVIITMFLNGPRMDQVFTDLEPGEQNISFTVKKDFFEMLDKTFNFKLELSYAGKVIQSRENLSVSVNKKEALIEYFDYLALNQNAVLPGTYEAQFAKYKSAIIELTKNEMQPMMDELNKLKKPGFWDSVRGVFKNPKGNITKKYKPLWKLDRKNRSKLSNPGIITQLFQKRNGYSKNGSYTTSAKNAYKAISGEVLALIHSNTKEMSDYTKSSFESAVCPLVDISHSLYKNSERQRSGDIRVPMKSGKVDVEGKRRKRSQKKKDLKCKL
jgi:hypothetical protein